MTPAIVCNITSDYCLIDATFPRLLNWRCRLTTDPTGDGTPDWADFLAHRERLLRLARARTTNPMDAEDAVQETLLRAAENRERLDKDRMSGWLTAVAARLSVDSHRRREREARHWGRAPRDPVPPGVDEEVTERDWAVWVASHLAKLPPRQRAALLLKAAGHDTSSVARELGVSYKSAESLLARARRTFRSLLLVLLSGVAMAWQVIVRMIDRSTMTTLLASGAGIVMLSALVFIQDDVPPRRPHDEAPPVHAPRDTVSPSGPVVTGSPRPGSRVPSTGPASPVPPSATPTSRPGNSPPVPLVPPLPSGPLPKLPVPSESVAPKLPLPTLDSLLLVADRLSGFQGLMTGALPSLRWSEPPLP